MYYSTKSILRTMQRLGGSLTIERVADELESAHIPVGAAMLRMVQMGQLRNAGLDGDKRLFTVAS